MADAGIPALGPGHGLNGRLLALNAQAARSPGHLSVLILVPAFEIQQPERLVDPRAQAALLNHFARHGLGSRSVESKEVAERLEADVVVDLGLALLSSTGLAAQRPS